MTRFEQFQQNVQRWATERGIYEHSTALAQALKAVSEVGELCDAVIKNDRDALIDAIGDTAVCLVNVAHMEGLSFDIAYIYDDDEKSNRPIEGCAAHVSRALGDLAVAVAGKTLLPLPAKGDLVDMGAFGLYGLCLVAGLDFDDCCESAWETIKDRKGRMVAGGAFVKEGE